MFRNLKKLSSYRPVSLRSLSYDLYKFRKVQSESLNCADTNLTISNHTMRFFIFTSFYLQKIEEWNQANYMEDLIWQYPKLASSFCQYNSKD